MALRRVLRPVALAACALLAACSPERPPDAGLPPGALFVARRAALERLLATAQQLEGTPLARAAHALAQRLPGCEWIEARAASRAELAGALACGNPGGPLAPLYRASRERDIALVLPLASGARWVARASVAADGSLAATLELPGDALAGAAAFLLPGDAPAGPSVLSASEQLAHARVRAGARLDLASLVSDDGQASRLFQLKSELFSGLVLDDTWEAALYLPEPGRGSPRAALALGVREQTAAVSAIEDFLENVRASWFVHRSVFNVGDAHGACLLDLNLLPELAPCYVATERALVIGWNAASVRKALDGATDERSAAGARAGPGALVLDLARLEAADAQLRALAPPGVSLLPQQIYPWRKLELRGERVGGGVELRLELAAKERA